LKPSVAESCTTLGLKTPRLEGDASGAPWMKNQTPTQKPMENGKERCHEVIVDCFFKFLQATRTVSVVAQLSIEKGWT